MEAVIVEIRAAEGGADAKDLVQEQLAIYTRLCARRKLTVELVDTLPGFVAFRVLGAGAEATFQDEPGGHRWQRVPENEKRGRVHTSTITVAVLPEPAEVDVVLREDDLEIAACRGSGPGGQYRNMTASAVQVKHLPTGLIVRSESQRSQKQNKDTALALLRAKLWQTQQGAYDAARAADRKAQLGCGARGDKRRTIRVRDDAVVDHVTGRRWQFKNYARGDW